MAMRDVEKSSYLNIANAPFIAELYERYLQNPQSVDESWQAFFKDLKDNAEALTKDWHGTDWARRNTKVIGAKSEDEKRPQDRIPATIDLSSEEAAKRATIETINVLMMIRSYRVRGHFYADLDPLGLSEHKYHPELDPKTYGFEEEDMDREVFIGHAIPGIESATVRDIVHALRQTYCSTIGVEYMHIHDPEIKAWIEDRIETIRNKTEFTDEGRKAILKRLIEAEEFERFLHTKYVGTKRFGLDGGESLIPAIEQVIKRSAEDGVQEIILGMAHRGRLNVLCNVMGKSYESILAEFEGYSTMPDNMDSSGDVKYHLGTSSDRTFDGNTVHLSLTANPSHLEAVDPVVLGKARAKQDLLKDEAREKALGILIHGDAAFAGQGIVPECFLLSELEGYKTGGTIHFIINNQIGFTTNPSESRSSPYCTDVAKTVQCPIFHVNGDDVEAVVHCARIASEYRAKFQKDVVVDMYCYRRFGHNEGDEPAFTQPLMYKQIKQQTSVRKKYAESLESTGLLSSDESKEMEQKFKTTLEGDFDKAKTYKNGKANGKADWLEGAWEGLQSSKGQKEKINTGAKAAILKQVGETLTSYPDDFNINPKIARQLEAKQEMFKTGQGFDWATAEALAFGTLLLEGKTVRLSGQDCRRGTFSQRHAVLFDQKTAAPYFILDHLDNKKARFEPINSPLSEEAVLGYEYGYTQADPNALVLWEGQFGDFVNGAQVIIDQFITSSEAKWLRMSGLVMLLPHGFEGQGPEHSSARLERFLQACAEDNIQVANCTTPANYFHILRRQLHRPYRKPLILMTPKSLLRHKLCVSELKDMTEKTTFHRVLPEVDKLTDNKVKRVVLCTGKVYYDLLQERRDRKNKEVAIIRLEQLYPFPEESLTKELKRYSNAKDVIWCQEEPENMGSWTFVDRRIEHALEKAKHKVKRPVYVGRMAAASPATGMLSRHTEQQKKLVDEALSI